MFTIRKAIKEDSAIILTLIKELAAYEELDDKVVATIDDINNTLFVPNPLVFALIIEVDSQVAGFVIYHHSYSTFLCKYCMHIEDLYIRESFRGKGYGEALVQKICKLAYDEGCARVDWVVLDWNTTAIEFYRHIGAKELSEWKLFRLDFPEIEKLAGK